MHDVVLHPKLFRDVRNPFLFFNNFHRRWRQFVTSNSHNPLWLYTNFRNCNSYKNHRQMGTKGNEIFRLSSEKNYTNRANFQNLMVVSIFGVCIGLLILATFFYLKSINVDLSDYGWVPVVTMCSCVFIYSCGVAAVPFVYVSDVLSNEVIKIAQFLSLKNSIILFTSLKNLNIDQ